MFILCCTLSLTVPPTVPVPPKMRKGCLPRCPRMMLHTLYPFVYNVPVVPGPTFENDEEEYNLGFSSHYSDAVLKYWAKITVDGLPNHFDGGWCPTRSCYASYWSAKATENKKHRRKRFDYLFHKIYHKGFHDVKTPMSHDEQLKLIEFHTMKKAMYCYVTHCVKYMRAQKEPLFLVKAMLNKCVRQVPLKVTKVLKKKSGIVGVPIKRFWKVFIHDMLLDLKQQDYFDNWQERKEDTEGCRQLHEAFVLE